MEADEYFICPPQIPYWIKKDKCDTGQLCRGEITLPSTETEQIHNNIQNGNEPDLGYF